MIRDYEEERTSPEKRAFVSGAAFALGLAMLSCGVVTGSGLWFWGGLVVTIWALVGVAT